MPRSADGIGWLAVWDLVHRMLAYLLENQYLHKNAAIVIKTTVVWLTMTRKMSRFVPAPVLALFAMAAEENRRFKRDHAAQLDLGSVGAIFGTVIGAIVILAVLGATVGQFITNADTVTTAVGNASAWTDATVGAIATPMGLFVGVGLLFGLVSLVLGAVKLRS